MSSSSPETSRNSNYDVRISLRSIVFFRNEEWIDDSAIDAIMETFSKKYDHWGTYFFVPTQILNQYMRGNKSNPSTEYRNTILAMASKGKEAPSTNVMAFAAAHWDSHWGVLCADFAKQVILFGHSTDKGVFPKRTHELQAFKTWLHSCGVEVKSWAEERLNVAQQGDGSGSCGIVALNAIERRFDPAVELWTSESSKFHRLRYLRFLLYL
ncbi:MAG: hypothetical protein J3Q66DRAFT_326082 [Benniella sp.]|nr:MAG: hypothetical protein J3Q66DRAFT_332524 [Benniella sp.]KAK3821292.1 MAG: hypothetical protein J3Q66DRAFT_332992 [Benniella sp.]KAK3824811.1 MAG: hypothetical protein J3Q66DRAFT_326082 [Benniella sp.]